MIQKKKIPLFLNINYGKQINRTAINNATVIGLEIGKNGSFKQWFGHQFSINLDAQIFEQGTLFVGFFLTELPYLAIKIIDNINIGNTHQ